MPITTTDAKSAFKKITSEASLLSPSSLVVLFEIDIEQIALDQGISVEQNAKIFRFHNNVKLINTSIKFKGNSYIVAPINAEGFEITSKGTLPTPKLSLTVGEEGIPIMNIFKSNLSKLGDFVGAKVTRIRTFAKYLDIENWPQGDIPEGFSPDSKAEFPRDIYYIERKSSENKFGIEFELGSILDVEGVKLPGRLVFANRCAWQYRGEGCCYEYFSRRNDDIHGSATLPFAAPPIATDRDEKIQDIIGAANKIKAPVEYKSAHLPLYKIGHSVYITKSGRNYYFVAKVNAPPVGPPNSNYWIAEQCSKLKQGCRLRWGTAGSVDVGSTGLVKGRLPFGGFPAADKVG